MKLREIVLDNTSVWRAFLTEVYDISLPPWLFSAHFSLLSSGL